MPNQRKKGKVIIGGYVDSRLKTQLRKMSLASKKPMSQVIEELLREALQRGPHSPR